MVLKTDNFISSIAPNFIHERKGELEDKLYKISKTIFGDTPWRPPFTVLDKKVTDTPSAGSNYVRIPYLMLFRISDIPEELIVTGKDDPKLDSDEYLLNLLRWTEQVANIPKQQLDLPTKEALRVFMKFILDPEKAEKAKDFILGHEVAHIFHKHNGHNFSSKRDFKRLLVAIAFFLIALGVSIFVPYAWIGLFVVVTATSVCAVKLFKNIRASHRCERQADLKAAAMLGPATTKGGIYFFETLRDHQKEARKGNFFLKFIYSPTGDRRTDYLTHPSENTRINYLGNTLLGT